MGNAWKPYGYGWITLGFFLISIIGHWLFGWFAYVDQQMALGQAVEASAYFMEMMRDTLENWQSEFLQLLWQVGGLAFLLFIGSPQSKEGSDRVEAKIDEILRKISPHEADAKIMEIDELYSGRHTDPHHAHRQ
jgi:hypothetical protein